MANPIATIERYIGGGTIYFTPYENGAYGTEIEIGEIKEASVKVASDTVEAFSQSAGPEELVEDVVMKTSGTFSYKTQNVNKENLAMALMGTLTTETFTTGATLPDGTTAAADTTVDKIVGMQKPLQKGKFRIVGEPVNETAKRPVLVIHLGSVKPTDSVGYIMKDFAALAFEGSILRTSDGFFDEYLMEVS